MSKAIKIGDVSTLYSSATSLKEIRICEGDFTMVVSIGHTNTPSFIELSKAIETSIRRTVTVFNNKMEKK